MSAPVSPYAGQNGVDALKGVELMPKSVDRIGESAAEEMEMVACALEQKANQDADNLVAIAKEKADRLRQFAEQIREQSRIANSSLMKHCDWVAGLIKATRDLPVPVPNLNTQADDGEPTPKFLTDRSQGKKLSDKAAAAILDKVAKEISPK